MTLKPIGWREACQFITEKHRHHGKPQGYRFAIGAEKNGQLVGVAMVGNPVARMLDDGKTAEVIRLCTDGTPNACSFLYRAAWRAVLALGFARLVTYILASEPGTSLRAAGFKNAGALSPGGSWTRPSRKRIDKAPLEPKVRWEISKQTLREAEGDK